MHFGLLLLLLSASWLLLAAQLGGPAWLLAWPAASAAVVAVGYLGAGPAVLGKRDDGGRAAWAWLLHLPFFTGVTLARQLQRLVRPEPASHEVAPGVHVGRLCSGAELPAHVAVVVDLTSELLEPADVRARAEYRCLPSLDGLAPPADGFRRLVAELADHPGPLYIHCAAGHGRSATLAAALLVARGLAEDIDGAQSLMRRARPSVRLSRHQRRFARRIDNWRTPD